jgi:hypothetical protein
MKNPNTGVAIKRNPNEGQGGKDPDGLINMNICEPMVQQMDIKQYYFTTALVLSSL